MDYVASLEVLEGRIRAAQSAIQTERRIRDHVDTDERLDDFARYRKTLILRFLGALDADTQQEFAEDMKWDVDGHNSIYSLIDVLTDSLDNESLREKLVSAYRYVADACQPGSFKWNGSALTESVGRDD